MLQIIKDISKQRDLNYGRTSGCIEHTIFLNLFMQESGELY